MLPRGGRRSYFGEEEIETVPCSTFPEMFDRMNNDRSLLGIIAIENTIAGSLLQNHELLRKSELSIIGEYKLRISHVLAALPGETMDDILEVNSHPMALMQCGDFLQAHPKMKVVEKTIRPVVPKKFRTVIFRAMPPFAVNWLPKFIT